ncbi:MAG: nuclear transport factor 2 family protein, partial [Gammaproteobacteria bacterium]|nr:nuclear transport factor 2 family protein [Gammaproteobacteria bacterium]
VIAAIGALLTGYLASGSVAHDDVSHANMMVHRNWAFAATSIFAIIALIDLMKRNEARISLISILLLVAGGVTLAKTGLEGAENVYQYGLGVQSLPDISTHEHSAGEEAAQHDHENADQVTAKSGHGHDEPSADESNSVIADDGHEHSHAEAPSISNTETSIEDPNHPASLLASELADAIAIGDVNSLRMVLAPDVLIFESGGVESSLAEYEGHHMPADMAFMKAMRREIISQQVIDSGDAATVVTRSRVYGIYKEKEVGLNSTETLVMKKLDGQWKVVHIHWSSS